MSLKKRIYKILGLIFFGLGLFGYYMPVFPGTIFMIIAAYFFMNSSDSLYKKIVNNPIYGSPIKQYVENNIISIKSKLVILLSIWIATFFSMYILINVKYSIALKILGITMSVIGTFFVLRAKNK
jgi:uncharacterized protein